MKLFMYLLVGGSAALLEWGLFYLIFQALTGASVFSLQTQNVLAATTLLCHFDIIPLYSL